MTTGLLALVAAVWGALTGLLLPRAAYRFSVPPGEPWRDRCPAGAHPVRGWLGATRCGACGSDRGSVEPEGGAESDETRSGPADREADPAAVGRQVPSGAGGHGVRSALLLAGVTALVCAALAAATGTRPELGVWLLLAPVGVLLATVDLRVRRLPDPLTLPFAAAALLLLGVTALLPEHTGHWPTALWAALALAAGHFALHVLNPDGMGFGDVKLAAGTGAVLGWYGWPTVLLGTFAAFLLGALYGGALVLARRAGRKTGVPFGPFLLAGTLAGLLTGAFAA
ncbi:prepilin peptidase [Streptomyces lavenduligriseus]|uniref:A24 family peptidase n=1 Tax=Streptomyces lavenduligriseus TaxID=67315 RepID=A0ABT0NW44_9ACTN|nr:A24 family peptidase [Streptomyces lavenduligriseus]MCL3995416.1 A24 family peptidase [Streptomyces lavenduligriseus]